MQTLNSHVKPKLTEPIGGERRHPLVQQNNQRNKSADLLLGALGSQVWDMMQSSKLLEQTCSATNLQ